MANKVDKSKASDNGSVDDQLSPEEMVRLLEDTLAEQKRLLKAVRLEGKAAWKREPLPKSQLAKVVSDIQDQLYPLQFLDVTSDDYWELVDSFKDLFVEFWYDKGSGRIFQVCGDEKYVISRDNLIAQQWLGPVPEGAVAVNRKYAERLEDNWNEEYDSLHRAADTSFPSYLDAVKRNLLGKFKVEESQLQPLLDVAMEYIKKQYEADLSQLESGQTTEELFLTESPARTADNIVRRSGGE